MVGSHAGADEARWVFVISQEATYRGHVALTERLGQGALVNDHDIVFEVSETKFVFESAFLHLDRAVLHHSTQFKALAWQSAVLQEERGRDALLRLQRFVRL